MNTAKINDILKYIVYGTIFLVPFIPFIVPSFLFFPFITGKGFAFRILVELMVGAWAILALQDPRYRPNKSGITILATIFVFIIGLADISGVNPLKSIWSNYERMEGLVLLIHLLGFLFVISSVLKTEKLWHRFFNTSVVASVLMGFYGMLQLAGKVDTHQGSRLDGTFGNSAYMAVYMLFSIFLTLFLYARKERGSLWKWFYGFAIVLQTVILYYTATRGALLGLIVGGIVSGLFVVIFEKENIRLKKFCIGGLVGIVVLAGLFLGIKNTSFVQQSPVLKRFADISLQENTTKARFMVWGMAYEGFKENPILGWGQENFNYVFNKYYNPGMYGQEEWFDRTHNVFFDWLIAGGLLGLLGYLSLFGAVLYYLIKDKNNNFSVVEKSIFVGMLTAYFIHNFFVFDNLISYIMFFSFLGYIHSLNIEKNNDGKVNEDINLIAIPLVIVLAIFSMYFFNVKGLIVNIDLINAMKPQKEGAIKNLEYYQKAVSYNSPYNQEVVEQLMQFGTKADSVEISPELKQKISQTVSTEIEKQISRDSENTRIEFMYGTYLAGIRSYEEAFVHLNKALELSPNKETILIVIGNTYVNSGNPKEGLKYLKKAHELSPESGNIITYYAATAIYAREDSLVKELLVPIYGTILVNDDQIINAYVKTKQYENAIKILEIKVKENSTDPQAMLTLGAVYLEAGYRAKSVEALKKTIELNPDFKDQGEYYIKQIEAGLNP